MRRLTLVLAAILVLPITALAQPRDAVVIGMRLEPSPGLDPTAGAAAAISEVTHYNIYEGLTKLDQTGAVFPMLARSWAISEDGRTYRFDLVPGVRYHDGAEFSSANVKFSFERAVVESSVNKDKLMFQGVESIETPDPGTAIVRLKAPNALFLYKLAQSPSALMSPASAAGNNTNPVGTGPYRFVRWTKGDSIELEKFAGHRNAGSLRINRVKFRVIADDTAQAAALLSGDLDYMPTLGAPELFAQFERNANFVAVRGNTEGETILSMNHKQRALSDVRVRRAIMHAINRADVIAGAQGGYATPIGSHFAPHHPAYVDLTGQSGFDPAKARALLREAGFPTLELSLKLPPPTYARRSGEIIAAMLADVGVQAKIENVEFPVWLDTVFSKKQYDLSIISHVEGMDLSIYANPNYYFQYDSPEYREILANFERATTVAEQTHFLQQAQRRLADDAVNGFLFQLPKLSVARKGLKGFWLHWPSFINEVATMSWEG
ncbi:MAG: ABC transporter substrate-binding protein [Alphaproteobacteria bacterium]|nr:ABC transporter substrate-binding protein [Alphaproteobacteria bacterium]